MFSPEERARIEGEAVRQALKTNGDAHALWVRDCLYGPELRLTRDDKAFLKQNHINPE